MATRAVPCGLVVPAWGRTIVAAVDAGEELSAFWVGVSGGMTLIDRRRPPRRDNVSWWVSSSGRGMVLNLRPGTATGAGRSFQSGGE